ncbi:MAG: ferritin-like domain-containing protein [Nannocystaceae bacterium]
MSVRPSRVVLAAVVAAALSTPLAGCFGIGSCDDPYDDSRMIEGTIEGAELVMIRESSDDDAMRCEQACIDLYEAMDNYEDGTVVSCTAADSSGDATNPWDPMNELVGIMCTVEFHVVPFCTGRRPHGHVELGAGDGSTLAWLRLHAHLERASIAAFDELSRWLAGRGAPAALVQRCRDAAADEAIHAGLFDGLVRRAGAEPARVAQDAAVVVAARDVALHNAAEGCVGEAFAAVVAAFQARRVGDPELRAVFSRIAADELRHGQLAWDLHAHLRSTLGDAAQREVDAALEAALDGLVAQAREAAIAAPLGLGWPRPREAEALARGFVEAIRAQRRAA